MLDRNRRIKARPERFQSCKDHFDIIVTCEERVYDQVIEGMLQLLDYALLDFISVFVEPEPVIIKMKFSSLL